MVVERNFVGLLTNLRQSQATKVRATLLASLPLLRVYLRIYLYWERTGAKQSLTLELGPDSPPPTTIPQQPSQDRIIVTKY